VLLDSFAKAGWELPKPTASMFVWAELPAKFKHLGSVEFAKRLMEGSEIAVAPGAGFGEYGDNFVRIALVENEQRIRQAARNLKKFLQSNAAPAATE
jgi:alanine-synthesizing transaminase